MPGPSASTSHLLPFITKLVNKSDDFLIVLSIFLLTLCVFDAPYIFMVLYCGRVPAANAPGCTAAEGLLYKPWSLVIPTCIARCLHQRP